MELLIIRLLTLLNSETADSTTFHIATVMLEHYQQIANLSIAEMANLANVSKSTLSKFSRKLGFDDYHDLKDNALFAEKRKKYQLSYAQNIMNVLDHNDYDFYFDAIINDIETLKNEVDITAIDRLALALASHSQVAAFGLMFSESAALDLQYKLAYLGKFIYTTQSDHQQNDYILNATDQNLIIVFTNSGEFLQNQQLLPGHPRRNTFQQSAAKIFAITANQNIKDLPYVDDAIIFPHETSLQTHAFLYQIIMDLVISKFHFYNDQAKRSH